MPSGVKWVFCIALCSVLVVSLAVGATVGSVYNAGMISVQVQPRGGGGINIAMPAAVAHVALAAVEFVPASTLQLDGAPPQALDAIEHYLPAAQEALDALARQPDFVLVEVHDDDESVTVRKEGRSIRVLVDSDDGRIDVAIPLSTVGEFTRRMKKLSREY
ncbi:MAG: hypothetical protein GTO30_18235 [Acidobacteria bacterium]|nr:hypothetical protein [Acidobacteriota bacterium]NIQ84472.1 hypothetical protein [Acidobacteriota bacterium]